MIVLQTLLLLYLSIWALPAHTFAHPCRIESDPDVNSALLLGSEDDPSPVSVVNLATNTAIPTLAVREWSYPTYTPPSPKEDDRPGIRMVLAILFPVIILLISMSGTLLYVRRKKMRGAETTGQVWGDLATARMDSVNNQTRQRDSRPPPQFHQLPPQRQQQQRDPDISVVDEAPPPYSREPPK